jgi:hypothetical protein
LPRECAIISLPIPSRSYVDFLDATGTFYSMANFMSNFIPNFVDTVRMRAVFGGRQGVPRPRRHRNLPVLPEGSLDMRMPR